MHHLRTYLLAFLLANHWLAAGAGAAVVHILPVEPLVSADTAGFRNINLDMNFDGQTDFEIVNDGFDLSFKQFGSNRITVHENQFVVRNLLPGTPIGPDLGTGTEWASLIVFEPNIEFGASLHSCGANGAGVSCNGDFVGTEGFFGVEFDIDGATHYGWVRAHGDPGFVYMTFLDWAYESEPGVPIAAGAVPEPTGALLVTLGACLLTLGRRRRTLE